MATLRCKEAFAANVKGIPRVVAGGDLVDAADPVVKGRENMFEPVDSYMQRVSDFHIDQVFTPVESATAAPGELRQVTKPKVTRKKAEPSDG